MIIYHLVYKTINQINGMYYIGKHQTTRLNDVYLGSGTDFRKALKEFGRANFKREILFFCESTEAMWKKEKELVTWDTVEDPLCYNMWPGGNSGFDRSHPRYEELCKSRRGENNGFFGKKHTKETLSQIHTPESALRKSISMTGLPKSVDHKKKLSVIGKTKIGELNSFYGKTHKTESIAASKRATKIWRDSLNEDQKLEIRVKRRKTYLKNCKKIGTYDRSFLCLEYAAEHFGICAKGLDYRCKSDNFPDVWYIN